MIKRYERTNCLEFFINALIEVTRDIDSESNYDSKDLNRSGINRSTDEEQSCYSSQIDYNETNERLDNNKEFNIKLYINKDDKENKHYILRLI